MLACQAILCVRTDREYWFWYNPFEHLTKVFQIDLDRVARLEKHSPDEVRAARAYPGFWVHGDKDWKPQFDHRPEA